MRTFKVLMACLVLLGTAASSAVAQATGGYSLDVIILWVKGGVPPERIWERYVSKRGLAFHVQEATERLRQAGATDEMLAMLRRAAFVPAVETAVVQDAPSSQPEFSRDELAPLYYRQRVGDSQLFVGLVRMTMTGGDADGHFYYVDDNLVWLAPDPLPSTIIAYGLRTSSSSGFGVDIEFSMHEKSINWGSLGISYEPFLPLGSSGWRAIVNATGKVGYVQQRLGSLESMIGGGAEGELEVVNWGLGWEFGGGMAYHYGPGRWIALDWRTRAQGTFSRHVLAAGDVVKDQEIPWSRFASRGSVLRLTFVF